MPLPPRAAVNVALVNIISGLSSSIEELDALIARVPAGTVRTALVAQRATVNSVTTALDNLLINA